MGQHFATCGHDITNYPWDYPAVWTQGFHKSGIGINAPWAFSMLCFNCVLDIMQNKDCVVQFSGPNLLLDAKQADSIDLCTYGEICRRNM